MSIRMFHRIKSFIHLSVLISLYYAFVQSHLSYEFVNGGNMLKLTLIDLHLFKIGVLPCFPHIIVYLIITFSVRSLWHYDVYFYSESNDIFWNFWWLRFKVLLLKRTSLTTIVRNQPIMAPTMYLGLNRNISGNFDKR